MPRSRNAVPRMAPSAVGVRWAAVLVAPPGAASGVECRRAQGEQSQDLPVQDLALLRVPAHEPVPGHAVEVERAQAAVETEQERVRARQGHLRLVGLAWFLQRP